MLKFDQDFRRRDLLSKRRLATGQCGHHFCGLLVLRREFDNGLKLRDRRFQISESQLALTQSQLSLNRFRQSLCGGSEQPQCRFEVDFFESRPAVCQITGCVGRRETRSEEQSQQKRGETCQFLHGYVLFSVMRHGRELGW